MTPWHLDLPGARPISPILLPLQLMDSLLLRPLLKLFLDLTISKRTCGGVSLCHHPASIPITFTRQRSALLRLPPELVEYILVLLWDSDITQEDLFEIMTSIPLVCKELSQIYKNIARKNVWIPSKTFYDHYLKQITNLPRSHPDNIHCQSLRFYLGLHDMGMEWYCLGLPRLRYLDALAYFIRGRQFFHEGIFPNLRTIYLMIKDWACYSDPYQALFPHFMPRTVDTLHIVTAYTPYSEPHKHLGPHFDILFRKTPIRYPSTPHPLKKLIVDGKGVSVTEYARLWESLFKVEELVVNGTSLPVGEDRPWGVDVVQVCDMLDWGCKGIGWNWRLERPQRPTYWQSDDEGSDDIEDTESDTGTEPEVELHDTFIGDNVVDELRNGYLEDGSGGDDTVSDDDMDDEDVEDEITEDEVTEDEDEVTEDEDEVTEDEDEVTEDEEEDTEEEDVFDTEPQLRRCSSFSDIGKSNEKQSRPSHFRRTKSSDVLQTTIYAFV